MNTDYAIEVRNVKKKFKVYFDKGRSLKEKVLFKNRNRYEERWVLNGISFNVKKGEAIGLIGHNGCGKSTTLKLLTRIMYPDNGAIQIKGRVSSLIELGAGFHPDMSGVENIYTNASIFGLTKKEIDARINDIIEFSELEEFLDNPVRTYSSGMYMRLAFSIAINVDADVLLIDEILAVGDINFQSKCFNKLREIKANGTTIVIVSHSLGQIEQICDRTIWIQDGLVKAIGSPRAVHPEYMDYMGQKRQQVISLQEKKVKEHDDNSISNQNTDNSDIEKDNQEGYDNKRWGNGDAKIINVYTTDHDNNKKNVFKTGDMVIFNIEYSVKKIIDDAIFGIGIFRDDGIQCYGSNTRIEKIERFSIKDDGKLTIKFYNMDLLAGTYYVDLAIQKDTGDPIDYYREAYKIEMYSFIDEIGISRIQHDWLINGRALND